MASGDTASHKLTLNTRVHGSPNVVELACSCGWKSTAYSDSIRIVEIMHIVEVLAARAGITVEW